MDNTSTGAGDFELAHRADSQNQRLIANVHPAGWTNPAPAPRYNLAVIGAGTAGLVAAAGAAGLGAKVALIERGLMGGDCLNCGCVPSKALIASSRSAASHRGSGAVDFGAVMERMRRHRADLSANDSAVRFSGLGVDVFFGHGRFVSPSALEVGGARIIFARAVIATGTRPAVPPIPGLAEMGFLTNETFFSLAELPRRLAIIGAGAIGCELGQAMSRLGSAVTMLEAAEVIMPPEDRDGAAIVERAMRADGVDIITGCRINAVAGGENGKILRIEDRAGARQIEVDEILVATGRRPIIEDLSLEKAGVETDRVLGVKVDDHLRTSNTRIYAAGDICSAHRFTHTADAQARIVIRNALFFGRARASALVMPRCTYTDPEIAHTGLSANEAAARGIRVTAFTQSMESVDRAVLEEETRGFVRVLVREGSDRIVGATIVARHAGEMISEITLAITAGVGLGRLSGVIHPYPTQAEAIKKIADAWMRTRLTPFRARILRRLFAMRR